MDRLSSFDDKTAERQRYITMKLAETWSPEQIEGRMNATVEGRHNSSLTQQKGLEQGYPRSNPFVTYLRLNSPYELTIHIAGNLFIVYELIAGCLE